MSSKYLRNLRTRVDNGQGQKCPAGRRGETRSVGTTFERIKSACFLSLLQYRFLIIFLKTFFQKVLCFKNRLTTWKSFVYITDDKVVWWLMTCYLFWRLFQVWDWNENIANENTSLQVHHVEKSTNEAKSKFSKNIRNQQKNTINWKFNTTSVLLNRC